MLNNQHLSTNAIADAIDRMMDTQPDALTIGAMRQWFDKLISETSDADRIAELELCREYFTDTSFRQKLEDYTSQATYKPEPVQVCPWCGKECPDAHKPLGCWYPNCPDEPHA